MLGWARWAGATAVASAVGMAIAGGAAYAVRGQPILVEAIVVFAVALLMAAALAIAQWLAVGWLHGRVELALWVVAGLVLSLPVWCAATMVVAFGQAGESAPDQLLLGFAGFWIGAAVGVGAALLEWRAADGRLGIGAGRWGLAGAVGWALGLAAMAVLAPWTGGFAGVWDAGLWAGWAGLVGGAIAGAVSGWPLRAARHAVA